MVSPSEVFFSPDLCLPLCLQSVICTSVAKVQPLSFCLPLALAAFLQSTVLSDAAFAPWPSSPSSKSKGKFYFFWSTWKYVISQLPVSVFFSNYKINEDLNSSSCRSVYSKKWQPLLSVNTPLIVWKDPDAGKDWGQEKKGTTEDEMVGWHHRLCGHEFG